VRDARKGRRSLEPQQVLVAAEAAAAAAAVAVAAGAAKGSRIDIDHVCTLLQTCSAGRHSHTTYHYICLLACYTLVTYVSVVCYTLEFKGSIFCYGDKSLRLNKQTIYKAPRLFLVVSCVSCCYWLDVNI
jgi:hypothetical protein